MAVSLHTRATTRTTQTDIHGSFTRHTRYYTHKQTFMEVSLDTRANTRTNRHSWKFHSTHALLHAQTDIHGSFTPHTRFYTDYTNRHSWKFHSTRSTTRTTQTDIHGSFTPHTHYYTHYTHYIRGSFTPHTWHLPCTLTIITSDTPTRRLIRRWLVRLLITDSATESVSSFFVHETRISMVCFVVLLSGQRALWVSRQCLLVFRSQRCITQRGERRTFAHPHHTDPASCRV